MAIERQTGSPAETTLRGKKSRAKKSPGAQEAAATEWELEKTDEGALTAPPGQCQGTSGGGRLGRGYPQKNAEILSSQYGLHLFLAGLLLMFAWAVHATGISKSAVLAYLITLMLLQLLWMAWYLSRRYAQKRLIQDKDTHAGACWLKCGITLFAVITLIMDSFKIGYFVGYADCLSVTEGIYPVTHAAHTLLQVYFLWCHAKDIIQSFKTLERFGVIHSVFTNLLLWTNGVLTESKHQLNEHKERLITLGFGNISIALDDHAPQCNCTTSTLCSIFSQGTYYLYPFNIEYHILASTMLYVLWKNIGRKVEHLQQHKTPFKFQGKTAGTILGLVVFITTIAVVVVYLIQIGRSKRKSELALTMFYLYAITVLALMCVAGIVALLIYRLEERSLDVSKNPARKLDTDLLIGTASGSWFLSWGSILAIICAKSHPGYTWYNLPYSILVIIEKYVQNLFIIESIHCEHEKVNDEIKTLRILTVSSGNNPTPVPSYKEIYNGTDGIDNGQFQYVFNGSIGLPESSGSGALDEDGSQANKPVTPSTSEFSLCSRKMAVSSKRSILKNIAAFLFLCNLSLWIPPAFGCRPEYDNGLEEMVFGFEPWIIVVNLAMPFSIFYRMHSAASLFETDVVLGPLGAASPTAAAIPYSPPPPTLIVCADASAEELPAGRTEHARRLPGGFTRSPAFRRGAAVSRGDASPGSERLEAGLAEPWTERAGQAPSLGSQDGAPRLRIASLARDPRQRPGGVNLTSTGARRLLRRGDGGGARDSARGGEGRCREGGVM